jgi:hypothetical protein
MWIIKIPVLVRCQGIYYGEKGLLWRKRHWTGLPPISSVFHVNYLSADET